MAELAISIGALVVVVLAALWMVRDSAEDAGGHKAKNDAVRKGQDREKNAEKELSRPRPGGLGLFDRLRRKRRGPPAP